MSSLIAKIGGDVGSLAKIDFAKIDFGDLATISKLPASDLAKINVGSLNELAKFDSGVLAKLDPEVLAKLDTTALSKIDPVALAKMDAVGLAKLDPATLNKVVKIDPGVLAKMDPDYLAKLDPEVLAKNMNRSDFGSKLPDSEKTILKNMSDPKISDDLTDVGRKAASDNAGKSSTTILQETQGSIGKWTKRLVGAGVTAGAGYFVYTMVDGFRKNQNKAFNITKLTKENDHSIRIQYTPPLKIVENMDYIILDSINVTPTIASYREKRLVISRVSDTEIIVSYPNVPNFTGLGNTGVFRLQTSLEAEAKRTATDMVSGIGGVMGDIFEPIIQWLKDSGVYILAAILLFILLVYVVPYMLSKPTPQKIIYVDEQGNPVD